MRSAGAALPDHHLYRPRRRHGPRLQPPSAFACVLSDPVLHSSPMLSCDIHCPFCTPPERKAIHYWYLAASATLRQAGF
ncbi:hypothetical protein Q1695_006797 [Nippostrongylus brasiliensis]|nr:hypothetical protein Q1695_006797 [Nippostrongylus brasiliensis]